MVACSGPGLSRPVLRWRLRRERLLYDPAPGARPWLLWLLAGCCEVWYCHWRLRSGRPRPVLSVSRILLSVLLFAGAITSLLGGRLDSVRILAQNVGAGWVLIKRFPSPNQIDEPFVETELDLGRREIRTFVRERLVSQGSEGASLASRESIAKTPYFLETICCLALITGESG